MKRCKRCGLELPLTNFRKYKKGEREFYQGRCRPCELIFNKETRDPEKKREYEARRRPQELERKRKLYSENKKHFRSLNEVWKKNHPGYKAPYYADPKFQIKAKIYKAEWKRNNKDKVAAQSNRRRANKLHQTGHVCKDYLEILINLYGEHCMYPECIGENLHVDHVIPLSWGGLDDIANMQLLCGHHNLQKSARHAWDFRPLVYVCEGC